MYKNNHHEPNKTPQPAQYVPKPAIRELNIDYMGIAIAYDLPLDTPLDRPLSSAQIASLPLPAEDKELCRNIHWRNLANLLHMEARYRHLAINIMHNSQLRTDERAKAAQKAQLAAQQQGQLCFGSPAGSHVQPSPQQPSLGSAHPAAYRSTCTPPQSRNGSGHPAAYRSTCTTPQPRNSFGKPNPEGRR